MNTLFDICKNKYLTYEELKEGIDKFGSEINFRTVNRETSLMFLCKHNPEIKFIKLLVQSGADVKIPNINHYLPYLFSSKKDFDLDVAKYFIELGCDIGYRNGFNNDTILHEIITNKLFTTKKLEILMKLKPDMINEVNRYGSTPLMYLCKYNPDLELVKLFIKYGADPKLLDLFGRNCLTYVFLSEDIFDLDVNIVEYLISQGCKFVESLGGNLLSLFAFDMSFDKIDFLARHNQKLGDDVNIKRQYFNFKTKLSFCSNQLFY